MHLKLGQLHLPLAEFSLEVDVELGASATAVFGPSGAGKTTLLELIAGLKRPLGGKIVCGSEVFADAEAGIDVPVPLRGVGYVPQDLALFPHMDVGDNLRYGLPRGGKAGAVFAFDHVVNCLEIATLLDRDVRTLSGGEKQRVALGRALVSGPRLLLLDEPLASLDRTLKAQILPLLERVKQEFRVPMLYVTHDPDEVRRLCDDVLVLERGQIVRRGPPDAVLK